MAMTRGDLYAGFEISRLIGSGPTGIVYAAREVDTATWVALKIVRASLSADTHFRRRLHATIQRVVKFGDPGVARLLDFSESQGRLWVATQFIDGLAADQLLQQRFSTGLPADGVRVIGSRMAAALDAAHARRLFHGDVKPSNLLIERPFSKDYRVLLTDFGHGDIKDPDASRFAAPEVLSGAPPDGRSDQFALAATMFLLLTGRPAFDEAVRSITAEGYVHFNGEALNDAGGGAAGLESVFATALAIDPQARFANCRDFAKELSNPTDAALSSRRRRPRSPSSQRVPPRSLTCDPTESELNEMVRGARSNPTSSMESTGALRSTLLTAAAALVIVVALTVAAVVLHRPRPAPMAAPPTPAANQAAQSAAPTAAQPGCAKLDLMAAGLTLRQKLAQLLMVGVTGIDDARAVINGSGVGGIMITSWTDLSMLGDGQLRDLEATAVGPLPLAVSVDEEGGRVQRLKNQLGNQPSPRVLAETRSPGEVRQIAFQRGSQMRDYGVTVDFAPVVDVTQESDDEVIGDRSFGSDPTTVIRYAGAYAQGLRDAHILPVLKHFPGHGRGSGDSHLGDVTTPPLSDLQAQDLVPYQQLTAVAPIAVMVGHLEVPGLTADQPTSLTPAAYSLLRTGDYGGAPFDGLIFTDDLSSMKAISSHFGVAEAALRALQAGADVALWTSTDQVPAVLDGLEAAVNAHKLDRARVDDALRQVAAAKNAEFACTP